MTTESEETPQDHKEPSTVLVVDDERNIVRTLRLVLQGEGYIVHDATNLGDARKILAEKTPVHALLLDVKLGEENGLDLLQEIKARGADETTTINPDLPVIMISGHASVEEAVKATRLGALDFLEKPLDRNRVVIGVRNAVERFRLQEQMGHLRQEANSRFALLGNSQVMVELRRQIGKFAPTKTRVLITGESGTGKELIARAIHRNSELSGEFVKVNCAAISSELIESELFGHERGAFTGAVHRKLGLFEVANNGTIFLDEIGDMSLAAQAKVLRVLQTGDFSRVGGEQSLTTNCRVVAATNKDLQKAVDEGEFREDLYFRLNVLPIHSPALRERLDDIALLVQRFIEECCHENGFAPKEIDPEVLARLRQYSWPGNVRELRNVVERLVILSEDYIGVENLPAYLGGHTKRIERKNTTDLTAHAECTLREFRDQMESEFIVHRLEEHSWNISRAAQSLGVERTNLHKKLRALGIERP